MNNGSRRSTWGWKATGLYPAAILLLVLLGAVFLTLYRPSFSAGLYLDSKSYLQDSHFFQGGLSLAEAFQRTLAQGYHPAGRRVLTNLTFALQTHDTGPRSASLIPVNVLLHAANTVLLFLALSLLIPFLAPGWDPARKRLCGAFAALAWGLNPFQVDTVAYAVQRGVLLETAFFLLAFSFLLMLSAPAPAGRRRALWLGLAAALAAAALSKENAVLFPVTAGAMVLYLPSLRERWRGRPVLLWALAGTAAVSVALMLGIRGMDGSLLSGFEGRPYGPWERLLTESRVVLHQLAVFFLPLPGHLTLVPFYPVSRGLFAPPSTLLSILALAAMTVASLRAGKAHLAWGAAFLWYLTGHLLESTILPLEISFPHRSYLPTALAFLPLGMPAADIFPRLGRAGRAGTVLAGAVLLAVLGWGTALRAVVWGDEERFWREAIASSPASAMPYLSLSGYFLERNRPGDALVVADQGLAQAAFADQLPRQRVYLLVNRGLALSMTGNLEESIKVLREARGLQPDDLAISYNLAYLLQRQGRQEEAARLYDSIIQADPSYPDAHLQKALILESRGLVAEALELLDQELRYYPRNSYARVVRSRLLAKAGR